MLSIERQFLSYVMRQERVPSDLEFTLCYEPLGTLTSEFVFEESLMPYLTNYHFPMIHLRVLLERYMKSIEKTMYLSLIEERLLTMPPPLRGIADAALQNKKLGTYLLPIHPKWMRDMYQLEDVPLTRLLMRYFPLPPVELFLSSRNVPYVIRERRLKVEETLMKLSPVLLKRLEAFCLYCQRLFRMNQRILEEYHRIAYREKFYLKTKKIGSMAFLNDANTPYRPQCHEALAMRIMAAAKHVRAFSEVRHVTSSQGLKSILDDGLYARRMLLNFYLPFKPASLYISDVLNGDANSVCLGPGLIDAHGSIEIVFDINRLIQGSPSAFYKQRDFGYHTKYRIREVQLGTTTLYFDHTGIFDGKLNQCSYLRIFYPDRQRVRLIAALPHSLLMAYDLNAMHEILTLNFFRFLDQAHIPGELSKTVYVHTLYDMISKLSQEDLIRFLTEIEHHMTDTAEFNFYGAHQIDFSTVKRFYHRRESLILDRSECLERLSRGDLFYLRRIYKEWPALFQSYRFLDDLLSHPLEETVGYYLDDLRRKCETPPWVRYIPRTVPEYVTIDWDLQEKPIVSEPSFLAWSNFFRNSDEPTFSDPSSPSCAIQ